MAYFKARSGPDAYDKRKAQAQCQCFCCLEIIPKGDFRFINSHRLSLCELCMEEWDKSPHGTSINDLSRNKYRT